LQKYPTFLGATATTPLEVTWYPEK